MSQKYPSLSSCQLKNSVNCYKTRTFQNFQSVSMCYCCSFMVSTMDSSLIHQLCRLCVWLYFYIRFSISFRVVSKFFALINISCLHLEKSGKFISSVSFLTLKRVLFLQTGHSIYFTSLQMSKPVPSGSVTSSRKRSYQPAWKN